MVTKNLTKHNSENIKRINVFIGDRQSTISMDVTLYDILEERLQLPDKMLSVRQWVQRRIYAMAKDNILFTDGNKPYSLSRRIQADAIRLIADPWRKAQRQPDQTGSGQHARLPVE